MSTIASGFGVKLAYLVESTHGTTPGSGTWKYLKSTGRNINLKKNMLVSGEVRSDRQVADVRHGFRRVEGSIPVELCMQNYDDFLEALTGGTWVAVTTSGSPNLSVVATTSKIVRATGSWITDGYRVNDVISTSGFTNSANNNSSGVFRITALTATDLTLDTGAVTLVDEASASGRTVALQGKRLDTGTTLRTFSIERQFADTSRYQVNRGMAVNNFNLNLNPERMAEASFDLIGMSSSAWSGSSVAGSPTSISPIRSPFSSFIGVMSASGSVLAVATAVSLTVENGRVVSPVLFSDVSPDVFEGQIKVRGEVTIMFNSYTLLNNFMNETNMSLYFLIRDLNGTDFVAFHLPKIVLEGADIDPPQEGPVLVKIPYMSVVDATYGQSISIQRSNVT